MPDAIWEFSVFFADFLCEFVSMPPGFALSTLAAGRPSSRRKNAVPPRGLSPDDTLQVCRARYRAQHVRLVQGCRNDLWFEDFALPSAAVLDPGLAASIFHQVAPHRLRRGREKVPPVFETLLPRQSQTGFMHQGRRIQRLARFLMGQLFAANRLSSSSISGNNLSAACASPRSIACNTLVISHITGHRSRPANVS